MNEYSKPEPYPDQTRSIYWLKLDHMMDLFSSNPDPMFVGRRLCSILPIRSGCL